MNANTNSPQLVEYGQAFLKSGLVHRAKRPDGEGPFPTVVMIHGRYGDEDAMWLFENVVPNHWLKVAPRGIVEGPPGRFSWVAREDADWPDLARFDAAVLPLQRFTSALPGLYQANPQQIYLMGFSQGAALSYALGMRVPGLAQGIAGLVGFVPEGCEEEPCLYSLMDLPVFIAVGKNDSLIPYERSLQSAAVLRKGGADVSYHEYDTGHKLNRQGVQDLKSWWRERDEERVAGGE